MDKWIAGNICSIGASMLPIFCLLNQSLEHSPLGTAPMLGLKNSFTGVGVRFENLGLPKFCLAKEQRKRNYFILL